MSGDERSIVHPRLGTAFERHTLRVGALTAAGVAFLGGLIALLLSRAGLSLAISLPLAGLAALATYLLAARKVRRRKRILAQPFPAKWEAVLQQDVAFFRALDDAERRRFRAELKIFLSEKRITGIKTRLDTRTRVLVGASAIIPIFGFPEWEWEQISEILVYPSRFDTDFSMDDKGKPVLGMVGTGVMNRVMILSKPDLVGGFRNAGDKLNVGLHEFAHLVDKSDGRVDGIPGVGLGRETIGPWIELVRRKMREIAEGESDIRRYALTNEAEFFSVVTEYFFERPGIMQRKHPDLFAMLQKVFRQDMASRLAAMRREISAGPKKLGRNSPCPCGSGRKYKKCCLE